MQTYDVFLNSHKKRCKSFKMGPMKSSKDWTHGEVNVHKPKKLKWLVQIGVTIMHIQNNGRHTFSWLIMFGLRNRYHFPPCSMFYES
jgi:hypothetical protein